MGTSSPRYKVPMALIGSLWGLACAIAILVLPLASSAPPPSSKVDVFLHALIVSAVYAFPFVLSLIALRSGTSLQLAAALGAGAILTVLGSISAMSGLMLLICPAAPLLFVGLTRTLPGLRGRQIVLAVGFTAVLVVLGICAFFALFVVHDDGVCWQQSRSPDGQDIWTVIPYSDTQTIAPATGVIGVICDSDTISIAEFVLSAILLGLAVAAWTAIRPIELRLAL